jgi:sugar lactone lactonase YvrE
MALKFGPRYTANILALCCAVVCLFISLAGSAAGQMVSATYLTSIPMQGGDPVRLAADSAGVLYVAVPQSRVVVKYAPDGSYAGFIGGFTKPSSVAVDDSGRVYVGDYADGSVNVMGSNGAFLLALGNGKGEFAMPGDIAISSTGLVYVTDSPNNVVKVYSQTGVFQFSFGGYGTANGQMAFPAGIAVDNVNQEVYVVDQDNGRVEVFDPSGVFKRTFANLGAGQGRLGRPQGIAVSGGFVYVVDAYQSSVQVFDTNGTFITFIGALGSGAGGLKVPMDALIAGTRLFVSDGDNRRVAAYDLTVSVPVGDGLTVLPTALAFSAQAGTNPPTQTIQVDPEVAGTHPSWTAVTAAPFILSAASGTSPATVTVSVNMAGLQAGAYNGTVTFTGPDGRTYLVTLLLTVTQPPPPPELVVSPGNVSMSYLKGDPAATASVSVTSTGSAISWTAVSANPSLVSVAPASGTTPGALTISLADPVNIAVGSYNTTVTVSGAGATTTAVIAVNLTVTGAGASIEVKTNMDGAAFTLTGPITYSGTGRLWKNDQAEAGQYTITFDPIRGYLAPNSQTVQVISGQVATVDVQYLPTRTANVIVAGKGPNATNDGLVKVMDLNGVSVSEFMGVTTMYGANVAMGDVDGDGYDEVIVTPGHVYANQALVNVFRPNGSLVASLAPVADTRGGAHAATGDVDGDGKSEIALGMRDLAGYTVTVYSLDLGALAEKARISLPVGLANEYPAEVAFGDVDGDGKAELIVSRENIVSVYAFNSAFQTSLLGTATVAEALTPYNRTQMSVSAGDISGDAKAEIIVGYYGSGGQAYAKVLKPDLTSYGLSFGVFPFESSSPSLSVMNADSDAAPEILGGRGNYYRNYGAVRIYKANGTMVKELTPFPTATYGASAAFGYILR